MTNQGEGKSMKDAPTITFTGKAFGRIHENMDSAGILERRVRVRVECVRTVWVVDAKPYTKPDDLTLPKGYDMDAIEELVARFIRETHTDDHALGWRMPPLSTAYLCDDGKMRTIGQMLEGISIELMPHDEVDFDLLLFSYGVDWTHPLVPLMRPHGLLA